jgi:hypothetical protein
VKVGKRVGTRTSKSGKTTLVRLPDKKPKKTEIEKYFAGEKRKMRNTLRIDI